jgi:Uma2 family endonuclease
MSATATRLTAEPYYELTEVGDRKQLVEGEIVVNEAKLIHAALQGRIFYALKSWTDAGPERGLVSLPTDVRMDEHNVYGPDLVWFSAGHVPTDLDGYPERVPDLCVEIRSQSTWRYDIGAKKRVYERGRLPELWLVDDASETVLVYRRSRPGSASFDVALELSPDEELASPQLPEFKLALETLFKR